MNIINLIHRFQKAKKKYGLHAFPKLMINKSRVNLRNKWRLLFNDSNYILIYDHQPPQITLPEAITIQSYQKVEDIPKDALQKIIDEMGIKSYDWLNSEFKAGSTLWLLFVDGSYVVRQLARYGKFFNKWFLPLNDNDFVFMAGSTFPEYRGRGLVGILTQYQMAYLMRNGGRAFADCKVWNEASRRFLEKIGFRKIDTMKNYWEGDSLHEKIITFLGKLFK